MIKPGGYVVIVDPAFNAPVEFDTFTCNHCNCIVRIKPGCDPADLGGFCTVCMKHICTQCHYQMSVLGHPCVPWEKQMDLMEARERARKSYGI